MSDGVRNAPVGRIYVLYGAAVFSMQTVERSLRVALAEALTELDQLNAETRRALNEVTLGAMIGKFDALLRPRFGDEFEDLKNYAKNRNYIAHQFFIDYVDAVGDEARDDKAEAFLRLSQREAILALHRIEVMTRELQLPEHMTYTERRDLELMERLRIESTERISIRKLQDA